MAKYGPLAPLQLEVLQKSGSQKLMLRFKTLSARFPQTKFKKLEREREREREAQKAAI